MRPKTRSYAELCLIQDFTERFRYLSVKASVGVETFGFERWLNQAFYTSTQWRQVRQHVIARDLGCDLGLRGHEIHYRVIIHHMNPMSIQDVTHGDPTILDPDYLITTSHRTHNAIHYGDESLLEKPPVQRRPGDTNLWTRSEQ